MFDLGIPKEIKNGEGRIALTPTEVKKLTSLKYTVLMELDAGLGSGYSSGDYFKAGAFIVSPARAVYANCKVILKVKEPELSEFNLLQDHQTIFAFLHLANPKNKGLVKIIAEKKITAIDLGLIQEDNSFPVLAAMSEITGEKAVLYGLAFAKKYLRGIQDFTFLVIGSEGILGKSAVKKIKELNFPVIKIDVKGNYDLLSTPENIEKALSSADIVIGAAASPNKKAPVLITNEMIFNLKQPIVIVDPAIDQGGNCEFSLTTSHSNPIIIQPNAYCCGIPNIPGAFPKEATPKLSEAFYPYILKFLEELKTRSDS